MKKNLLCDLDVWVPRLGSRSGSVSVCVLVPV